MQSQGLPYTKRAAKTRNEGSIKDFLVASGKQLDIKSENVGGLGSKHAKPEISQELYDEAQNVKVFSENVFVEEKDEGGEANHMELEDETFVDGLTSEDLNEIYAKEGENDENEIYTNKEDLDEIFTANEEPLDEIEIYTNEEPLDEIEIYIDKEAVDENEINTSSKTSLSLDDMKTKMDKEGTHEKSLGTNYTKSQAGIDIESDISSKEGHVGKLIDHHSDHEDEKNEGTIQKLSSQKDLSIETVKKITGEEEDKIIEQEADQSLLKDLETDKKKRKCLKRTSYICPICGKTLANSSKNEVERHAATHTGDRNFKCEECGSGFSRDQELRRHKKIHTGHCPFRCNHCQAGFKAEVALRAHKNSIHNDKMVSESESNVWLRDCKQCNSNFKSATTFGKHMKLLHGVGKLFICDKCGIGMSTPDNLKRHALIAHSDSKPFHCEECGSMFDTKASLMKHQLQHIKTSGSLSLEQGQEAQVSGEQSGKRICDLCGKTLSSTLTMQRHMRIHEGLKSYTCKECGKAYGDKRNLDHHIDIVHQRLKKFPCAICGDRFGRRNNLKDHEKRKH